MEATVRRFAAPDLSVSDKECGVNYVRVCRHRRFASGRGDLPVAGVGLVVSRGTTGNDEGAVSLLAGARSPRPRTPSYLMPLFDRPVLSRSKGSGRTDLCDRENWRIMAIATAPWASQ